MRLVTRFEAATCSTIELRCLLKKAFAAAVAAPPCSQEYRDAQASIRNIKIELSLRSPCP